jgi:alpha-glucosidase
MVWDNTHINAGFSDAKPWLPVKAPQAVNAVAQQMDDGILAYYKSMISLRKNSPVLSHGTTSFVDLPEPLLAFTRNCEDKKLACVFNLTKDVHSIALKDAAEVYHGQAAKLTKETLTLGGNGFAYLSHAGAVPISVHTSGAFRPVTATKFETVNAALRTFSKTSTGPSCKRCGSVCTCSK